MLPRNVNAGRVFEDLVRTQVELWNAVDARLRAEHDVGLGSLQTMTVIGAAERCRVFDIADRLAITVGGASKIVDRLEGLGLAARRANPGDRRSSLVELTPSGRTLLGAATVTFDAETERLLGPSALAPSALAALSDTLAALRHSPATATPPAAIDTATTTPATATDTASTSPPAATTSPPAATTTTKGRTS